MKKVIIYAHVNLNIIDGSAVWLKSLVEMISEIGLFEAHVILKQPVKEELKDLPFVKWINPFKDIPGFDIPGNKLDEEFALSAIRYYDEHIFNADFFIIRQIQWERLSSWDEKNLSRSYIYNIAGLVGMVKEHGDVLERCGGFLAQTDLMLNFVKRIAPERNFTSFIMPPMVPNKQKNAKKNRNRLIYTGKFTTDWQVAEMIVAFSDIRRKNSEIEFHIAGDKFDGTVKKEDLLQLLQNTPNVVWHERLSRDESIRLIETCGVGLGYRKPQLSNSLEVSTKLLEYCISGLPVITNNGLLHNRLFGNDYPFFADSIEEFKEACLLAVGDANLYAGASDVCEKAAEHFGYKKSGQRFKEFFY